jgi:hypothetical protein
MHLVVVEGENLTNPLFLRGIMSYLNVCMPTLRKIEQSVNIDMTSEHTEWEPYLDLHLEAVYSIYGYLKSHNHSNMVFDPFYVHWKNKIPSL